MTTALFRRACLALPLFLALAACTPAGDDFGQCEPGVGDLGRTETVCP